MTVSGPSKTPLALTNLRGETLADMNRGRLRGWAVLAIAAMVVFAILAWPDLVAVFVLGVIASVVAAFVVKVTLATFSDAEGKRPDESDPARDSTTGELD